MKKKRQILKVIAIIIMIIIGISIIFNKKETIKTIDPELARMMTYQQFVEDDFKTNNDYVRFGAFFLRDLDGDGYAEKIAGTSKEIGKTDTLYMNLNVNTEGYIKDGIIKISGENFKLQTAIVKDSVVKNNAIGLDTTEIQLNDLYPGTTKLLMGTINSKIGSVADYSTINQITFAATYVDPNGEESLVEKTIDLTVDWYGDVNSQITTNTETIYANESINEEEGTIDLRFKVTTKETKEQLILTENNVRLIVPQLNGYKATNVELEGSNGTTTFNEETGDFEITRIGSDLPSTNTYTITVTYPIEAYTTLSEETISVLIPVETYHIGSNNPNEEFENPKISETAAKTITIVIEKQKEEQSTTPKFSTIIGKYVSTPNARYVISKKLPLKRYLGEVIEQNTEYTVQWKAETGTDALKGLKLEQTSEDTIYDGSTEISMAELTKYTGIYIVSASAVVGEDGYINVIDAETDEIIHTFTSSDWSIYTADNPYKYETPFKNIRIETSSTLSGTTLMVYNIKEIDDETLTKTYDEEEIQNLTQIKTYLTGTAVAETDTIQNINNIAYYEEESSKVSINLSKPEISTQDEEKNELITIETLTQEYNTAKWINGQFIVKFPPDIALVEVNGIKTSDETVKVLGYEIYREDGCYFIKMITSNETETSYQITIDCNLQADPRISTTLYAVELYASNENCETYQTGNSAEDIYDVNGNTDITEIVGYNKTDLNLIAPGSLTTSQIASEYDSFGSTTLAPQIAEITPEAIVDSKQQNPKIAVQIRNNYTGTISETVILGKIPFKGNTDGITGNDLGSTYTTIMKSEGLSIPENLQDEVTIYYSSNENPTTDTTDVANGWTTAPTDWTQVKTYLIDFNDYVLSSKEECVFIYEIELPDNVSYNEVSYSTHKVEFYLDTENGKLKQEIEPRKLGFRIAKKYDFELIKYKKGATETLQGVTFKLIELDDDGQEAESRIRTTDENGVLNIEDLYVEKTYILKEIKTLAEYDLNSEEIKFVGIINENGDLVITVLEGTFKDNKIDITQATEAAEKSVVHVALENEVKYNVIINKTDENTGAIVKGIEFTVQNGGPIKTYMTNSTGQIKIKGLSIGNEYTLTETTADGYYLLDNPIKFKIYRDENGLLQVNVTNIDETLVTYNLEETEGVITPILNFNIKNTPIPKYNLDILKVEKQMDASSGTTEQKALEGAQFEIYSFDLGTNEIYTTDANGKILLEGLYEYVEGKNITGKYTLKEIYAPEGYTVDTTELTFRAQRNTDGNIILTILEGKNLLSDAENITGVVYDENGTEITTKAVTIENAETENPTIGITVGNESIFSLLKTDSLTREPVEGAKFTIYKIDENYEIIEQAKDIDGETLGTLETIEDQDYYVVTTDINGRITAHLGEGLYKIVEVKGPEGYLFDESEENRTNYFGIGQSKPAERNIEIKWTDAFESEGTVPYWGNGATINFVDSVTTSDSGHIVVGNYAGTVTIDEEQTVSGESITVSNSGRNYGYIIIKYNVQNLIEWVKTIKNTNTYSVVKSVDINNNGEIFVAIDRGTKITIPEDQTVTQEAITFGDGGKVLRLDENGLVMDGIVISGIEGVNAKATSDGGYILTADTYGTMKIAAEFTKDNQAIEKTTAGDADGIVVKVNSDNLVEWVHHISNAGRNKLYTASETYENEYIVGGEIWCNNLPIVIPAEETVDGEEISIGTSSGGTKGVLIKYNENGLVKSVELGDILKKYIKINDDDVLKVLGSTTLVKAKIDGTTEWSSDIGMEIKDVILTNDNGYLAIGSLSKSITIEAISTTSGEVIEITNNGGTDAAIVKYNSDAKIEWAKILGSMGTDDYVSVEERVIESESANQEIQYVTYGNFEGQTKEIDGLIGAATVVYSSEGKIISTGNIFSSNHKYFDVINTNDGGGIAVGKFEYKLEIPAEQTLNGEKIELYSNGAIDSFIIGFDANGKIKWAKSIGGGSNDYYYAIEKVGEEFIVVGSFEGRIIIPAENTENNQEIVIENTSTVGKGIVVKYNNNGQIVSAQTINGSRCTANDVKYTEDGYVVVGTVTGTITIPAKDTVTGLDDIVIGASGYNGIIIKYNLNDKVEWGNSETGTFTKVAYKNGSYVALGSANGDNLIVKYDSLGQLEYSNVLDCTYSGNYAQGIIQTNDGGAIVVGYPCGITIPAEETVDKQEIVLASGFKGFIVKYNSEGLVEFAQTIIDNGGTLYAFDIQETEDGGYTIVTSIGNWFNINAEKTSNNTAINASVSGAKIVILKYNKNNKIEWYKSTEQEAVGAEIYTSNNIYTTIADSSINQVQLDILEAEVPSAKLLEITNTKKEFKISATVDGEGGQVVIGASKLYENVKYNENSVEDIIITPETGYQIKTIEINEQNYEFVPEEDGTVTLSKFENVTQNKNIVVTFVKIEQSSNVIIHHYKWENGAGTTTKLVADEQITGELGETYSTTPKVGLEKYELITNSDYYGEDIPEGLQADDYYIPENSIGTIAEGIEVIYYYKSKTYTLTIHHYLDGTKESIVPDTIKTELATDTSYTTNIEKTADLKYTLTTTINGTEESEQLEIDAQRYKILSIDGVETGTITANTEITYYYTDTAFDLTVEKVWEDNENSGNTRPEQITIQLLKNGAEFKEYILDISNNENIYTFTELYKYDENEKEITYEIQEQTIPDGYYLRSITKENNKVTIINSKLGSITINKVDKKTSEPLQGAEFKIEKKQGNDLLQIQTVTTDENGQAKLEELQYGTYKLTETKAPEGYNLNRNSQEVEINSSNIDGKITITNREKTILPDAGGGGAYLITVIGLITIISGFIIKNNQTKNKGKH